MQAVWKFNSDANSSLYILTIEQTMLYIYGSSEILLGNCNKNTEYEEKDTVRLWMVRLTFPAGHESVDRDWFFKNYQTFFRCIFLVRSSYNIAVKWATRAQTWIVSAFLRDK